jgi:hypothetical protein
VGASGGASRCRRRGGVWLRFARPPSWGRLAALRAAAVEICVRVF